MFAGGSGAQQYKELADEVQAGLEAPAAHASHQHHGMYDYARHEEDYSVLLNDIHRPLSREVIMRTS